MFTLVKRNIRLYISDPAAVFFSLLGALIAVLLVLLFLKSSIVNALTDAYGGLVDAAQAGQVLDAWLVASASVIASATTGLAALRQFVDDKQTARWRDFLVTPLPSWAITGGYLLAAAIVSVLMTSIVYGLGTVYCLGNHVPLAWGGVCAGWGWLVLSSLGFTGLMGCVVSLLSTDAAFSGFSIIVGVLFGFLSETYVTHSILPTGVARALGWLPFAQASALVRQPYVAQVVDALPASVRQATVDSLTLTPASLGMSTTAVAGVLAAMAVVFFLATWQLMARAVRR